MHGTYNDRMPVSYIEIDTVRAILRHRLISKRISHIHCTLVRYSTRAVHVLPLFISVTVGEATTGRTFLTKAKGITLTQVL